ncbi:hypothetical protein DUI87_09569 [Hirundo rustica rustica]|uniref:Uncharacterized protein n=1 Tax=Hirundo rustica rustica TaxID=333673 RepID=A0A3M0KN46_HIRRU|nr:hypothetical protein DUI87_09569 [Hirundo rustica rustica]
MFLCVELLIAEMVPPNPASAQSSALHKGSTDLERNLVFHRWKKASKMLPVALDKYKSVYRKDYCWHDDYHSPTQAHVPVPSSFPALDSKLPARLGTVPEGRQGALVLRPSTDLVNYPQLAQDLYLERLYDADKNRTKSRSSSIFLTDFSDLEWKSIYKQDYKGRKGIFAELYTEEMRPSPLLPEDNRFNTSRWVTEYADSYNIFLKRLDWSSPIAGQWLPFGKDARWTPRWRESLTERC